MSAHRVVVIDSDGAMRRLLRLAPDEFGCDASNAGDDSETLAMLRDHRMCALIVDVSELSMSRWSVLKALGEQRTGWQPGTIAISSDCAALISAAKLGVDATLLKPFSLLQLRTVIENLAVQEGAPHAPMMPLRLPAIGSVHAAPERTHGIQEPYERASRVRRP